MKKLRVKLLATLLAWTLMLTWIGQATAETLGRWTVTNHTTIDYQREMLRLDIDLPEDVTEDALAVYMDNKLIVHQLETIRDAEGQFVRHNVWVCINLKPGDSASFAVERVDEQPEMDRQALVTVKGSADESVTLSNGKVTLELVGSRDTGKPGPIVSFQVQDEKPALASFWEARGMLETLTTEVLEAGPLFAKVRLHYSFFPPFSAGEDAPNTEATLTFTLSHPDGISLGDEWHIAPQCSKMPIVERP